MTEITYNNILVAKAFCFNDDVQVLGAATRGVGKCLKLS